MNPSKYRVRRATLEDLSALSELWSSMHYRADELRNRLTEFQVAMDSEGNVIGTVGFQILPRHGLVHSEAFKDFSVADTVRPLFWGRIQALAMNHGLARLWTRENAPYWSHNGFQPPTQEAMARLPEAWGRTPNGWLTIRLKDEDVITTLDHEFALFRDAEKQSTARTLNQARRLKSIFLLIGILASLALVAAAVYVLLTRNRRADPRSDRSKFIRVIRAAHQGTAGYMHESQPARHIA